MQLSRYQYWVLDYVFTSSEPLCDLAIYLKDGINRLGNNGPPGESAVPLLDLTVAKLAEIILALLEMGYISLDGSREGYVPRYGEILVTLHGLRGLGFYELTDLGGKIWEEYSKPNWDYYIYERTRYIDDQTYDFNGQTHHIGFMQVRCASRETLERWIMAHQIEPSRAIALICRPQFRLIPGSVVSWQTIEKWQPTYWKTLDYGFQAELQVIPPGGPIFYVENKVMTEEELTRYLFPLHLEQNWCYKYFDIANPSR
jgi:hypothetical protein